MKHRGSALKVYLDDEVVDLRGKDPSSVKQNPERKHSSTSTYKTTKNFERNFRSSIDIGKRMGEQKLLRDANRHTNYNQPLFPRFVTQKSFKSSKLNVRAISLDSRFRRKRTRSPEGSQSAVTLSHYSTSLPAFTLEETKNKKLHPQHIIPPNEFHTKYEKKKPDTDIDKGGEKEKLEAKTIEIVDAGSDYASATGGTDKAINTSDITAIVDYKYEAPVSPYWDDPRLVKKYIGLVKPKQQKETDSCCSVPLYIKKTRHKTVNERNTGEDKKLETATYIYEEEETDGESDIKFREKKLFWPFYVIGSLCGIGMVALIIWFALEKDAKKMAYELIFNKPLEPPPQKNVITKVFTYIIGTLVYIVNKAIKQTTHILVVPRKDIFTPPQEDANWWNIF